jgi:2-keto-4-pentenoate hydratase/2-oxohepta-3-ene-1,7-dioic acid hydratase in catechol pathway
MRIANRAGRLVLLSDNHSVDVETASDGQFSSDPQRAYDCWEEFIQWAKTVDVDNHASAQAYSLDELDAPVPAPKQVFAIGLNYRDHAEEANLPIPEHPVVFTKFSSSLTGPTKDIKLSSDTVDWELELVVVIGQGGHQISEDKAWDHVAGLTVGQDISDRTVQFQVTPPQFSLGKSFPGYSPTGPAVVTLDEFSGELSRDDLALTGVIVSEDGSEQVVQEGSTASLIFSVPQLIARLSEVITLMPGDLIFTGTPAGVGTARTPKQFLQSGQTLVSRIAGIGEMRNRMV